MRVSDFDYHLPKELIAQNPMIPRDHSRLMAVDSLSGAVSHCRFFEVGEFLRAGDVLVVNRSRVLPARIIFEGKEIFLLKKLGEKRYEVLVKPGKKFKTGAKLIICEGLSVEVIEEKSDGSRVVEFAFEGDLEGKLEKLGRAPLPPYITDSTADFQQYQTVYAREKGSVAAPTAGLHFTDGLIKKLRNKGVEIVEVILHVGRGTFQPVTVEKIEQHEMHGENYEMPRAAADALNRAVSEKRRIVAVGTTSVRVLESCFRDGKFAAEVGETKIFIYHGYNWKVVDAMITNFHLPKSTLLMLVASFLEHKGFDDGRKKVLELYDLAQKEGYRFYSFGDAMMVI